MNVDLAGAAEVLAYALCALSGERVFGGIPGGQALALAEPEVWGGELLRRAEHELRRAPDPGPGEERYRAAVSAAAEELRLQLEQVPLPGWLQTDPRRWVLPLPSPPPRDEPQRDNVGAVEISHSGRGITALYYPAPSMVWDLGTFASLREAMGAILEKERGWYWVVDARCSRGGWDGRSPLGSTGWICGGYGGGRMLTFPLASSDLASAQAEATRLVRDLLPLAVSEFSPAAGEEGS